MKRLKIQVQPPSTDEPKAAFFTIPDECFDEDGLETFRRAQTLAFESLGATLLSMTLVEEMHTEI